MRSILHILFYFLEFFYDPNALLNGFFDSILKFCRGPPYFSCGIGGLTGCHWLGQFFGGFEELLHGLFDVVDVIGNNWFFVLGSGEGRLGSWDGVGGYFWLGGVDGGPLLSSGVCLVLRKRLFCLTIADVEFGLRGGMGRAGDFIASMSILFFLVVKDIHKLLKNFLIL